LVGSSSSSQTTQQQDDLIQIHCPCCSDGMFDVKIQESRIDLDEEEEEEEEKKI